MKESKFKRIGLILIAVLLAFAEFGLDMWRAGRHNGWVFILFVALAVLGLYLDIKRTAKTESQEKEQDSGIPDPMEAATYSTMKATGTALGGLDWMLRKINPDYDPEGERNARNVGTAALAKLDEMKSAGLIDEKEYQKRKKELAGK